MVPNTLHAMFLQSIDHAHANCSQKNVHVMGVDGDETVFYHLKHL